MTRIEKLAKHHVERTSDGSKTRLNSMPHQEEWHQGRPEYLQEEQHQEADKQELMLNSSLLSSGPNTLFPHGIHGQRCNDNRCTCPNKQANKNSPHDNCTLGTDTHDLWKDSDVAGLQRGLQIRDSCANSPPPHAYTPAAEKSRSH